MSVLAPSVWPAPQVDALGVACKALYNLCAGSPGHAAGAASGEAPAAAAPAALTAEETGALVEALHALQASDHLAALGGVPKVRGEACCMRRVVGCCCYMLSVGHSCSTEHAARRIGVDGVAGLTQFTWVI